MKTLSLLIITGLPLIASPAFAQKSNIPLYKDKNAPIEKRVDDLLSRMTLEEKVYQMENKPAGKKDEIEKIFQGNSYGCTHEMGMTARECAEMYYNLQKYMLNNTRLGIPLITAAEGIQGVLQNECTLFPHAIAQGSTFNLALIQRMTEAAGEEARVIGIRQVLSPVLDITRELRWGRVEETFGEDPFLIAEMGIHFVKGYHKQGVACMPKHFVAHGTPVGGLNCAHVSGGERELQSLYLYPFRRVIKETNPQALMSAYSAYDGVATAGSSYYMTDILRGELGFNGYVYSDWGSVERLKSFHYATDTDAGAAQMSVEAGVDLNVGWSYSLLPEQVKNGKMDIKYIDQAVRRILTVKFALGLFDNPSDAKPEKVDKVVRNAEKVALAKEIADESAVLLENKNNILPLNLSKYKTIAVVGPNSNQTVFGDYAWTTSDTKEGVTLLQGLHNAIGNKASLLHAEGCDWWSQDSSGIEEAVNLVKKSDVAIVAVGTRSTYLGRSPNKSTAGEGFDLSSLDLPGKQQQLLEAIKATGKPLIVVLISGKPMVLSWAKENADAILLQWYAGEQQGNSVADILTGKVNPSGRLNVSFPRSTGNTPCFYNYYPTDREQQFDSGGSLEDPKGHYIFEKPYALWNFGYGLSYTNYNYVDCRLNDSVFHENDKIIATVKVENTGNMDGKEVIQLYVKDKISSVATPVQQLKAFKKELIKAGKQVEIQLEVPIAELALYDARMNRVVEPGEFEIQIGSSSDRIAFKKTITVNK
ncbi:glycoside hydrolase family 3 N-terminal domain-containing protein [Bacteroides sp. 519]|uniref:glycoside hydrolase family 3 N-terminal domain-containing protein n=1 Tax=Bacteroides sp. 519 TaxID=2302937 RepID=UPI0013D30AD0|nr:glycoside hydrolase family 3 N-terminal domain-containing protein [Bacteroides sp. 519]NDV57420.1 glycosyl hydrolase [Bacteroides sp. 519]